MDTRAGLQHSTRSSKWGDFLDKRSNHIELLLLLQVLLLIKCCRVSFDAHTQMELGKAQGCGSLPILGHPPGENLRAKREGGEMFETKSGHVSPLHVPQ